MPDVPIITGATVPLRGVRVPRQPAPSVNLQAVGQGLLNAGESLRRAELEISQITLAEADAEFISQLNNRLYNDDDAYFKRVGKDAVEGHGDAMTEIDKIRDEVARSFLTNARERTIFNLNAQKRLELARVKMSAHAFDERKAWDLSTSEANMAANLEAAASDPSPENLRLTRVRIEEEAANIAKIQGLPPEKQAQLVSEALSGMYRAAIEMAMVKNLNTASELLKRFEDDINHADETALRKSLKAHMTLQRGAALADQVVFEGGTIAEMTEKIRKRAGKDIEARDDAIRRMTNRVNQDEADKKAANSKLYNDIGNAVLNREITTDEIRKRASDQWENGLIQSQREHILALEAALNEPNTTDWGRWSELVLMPAGELAEIEPMDERLNLADPEFKVIAKAIVDARKGDLGFTPTTVLTAQKQLQIAIGGAKQLERTKGKLASQELRERLGAFEIAKEGKATETEIAGIISRLMVEITLPTFPTVEGAVLGLFGFDFDSKEVRAFAITTDNIPKVVQADIIEWWERNRGREPTDNEMIDHFVRLKAFEQSK